MLQSDNALEFRDRFAALLKAAADNHASEVQIALAGPQAQVSAVVRGERMNVAQWPAEHCPGLLEAAYGLCEGSGDDFTYGKSYSLRMTGRSTPLPEGVTMILVQFLPPKDGARHLVARITRESDTCCGSCGG